MLFFKRFLSPTGRQKYSAFRKYITERFPRLYRQIIGRDLRYFPQKNWRKEHIGSLYDGKRICLERLPTDGVVYSFGVGRDISFDLAMIEKFGMDVYAFDPTPVSGEWVKQQTLPEKFHFYAYGLADYDGFAEFYPFDPDDPEAHDFTVINQAPRNETTIKCPVYKLGTLMQKLGHQEIDVLKMDIEGSEYTVLTDFLASGIDVTQLLIEFHHRFYGVGLEKTRESIRKLNNAGYKIFHISPDGQEYGFVKA